MKEIALITGSNGLIGSEAVRFLNNKNEFDNIIGIDNNMRKEFFGEEASTEWCKKNLINEIPNYIHYSEDIRDSNSIENIFKEFNNNDNQIKLIIHTASQPSHDWAAREPFTDFNINAFGTLVLLENYRKYCPDSVFIFVSTNKVYGDNPNKLPLIEQETMFDLPDNHLYYNGIDETMSIDNCKHSLFGVSKASADLMVQEYGKYFGLNTGIFRCGCVTGSGHSPAQLHGFLSYLVYCIITGKKYYIYGYKGKQVRDNIHAYDLVTAFDNFYENPIKGEVYNMGGSRHSYISVLEAIKEIEKLTGKKANIEYVDKPRIGDHIWYISDVSKFKTDYPDWNYKYGIHMILKEMCDDYTKTLKV